MNDGGLLFAWSQSEDSTAITELKELRTSSQAVLAENQKLLAEVGKVKKSVHSLRKALNGPSADLATLNAQLRAENETLKAVVVRATLAVLPPPVAVVAVAAYRGLSGGGEQREIPNVPLIVFYVLTQQTCPHHPLLVLVLPDNR